MNVQCPQSRMDHMLQLLTISFLFAIPFSVCFMVKLLLFLKRFKMCLSMSCIAGDKGLTTWKHLLVLCPKVTQARTKKNRNDAPVSLGPPPGQGTLETQQPQKTPSKRQTTRNDVQTTSVQRGLQAPIGKMTQDISDHSRGSNESHRILSTDLQKPTFESLDGGANTRECNVSSLALQSQADTAVKTVEGTGILVNEKVEGNEVCKVLKQTESVAPTEKIVEMETEAAPPHDKSRDAVDKDADVEIVEASSKERNEPEVVQENCPELLTLKPNVSETVTPQIPNKPENTQEQSLSFKEIPKPVSKVISIAELLRSQLKALDPTLVYSVPVQEPAAAAPMTYEGLRHDDRQCTVEVKKSTPDSKSETITDDTPPTSIKATLMAVYRQLNETIEEQIHTPSKTSPPLQAPQKQIEGVVDTGQETGASRSGSFDRVSCCFTHKSRQTSSLNC